MGNKINSLRAREEEELDDNGNVRARSISVGGGGSGSSIRAMSSSMSAPSGSRLGFITNFFNICWLPECYFINIIFCEKFE